MIAVRIGPDMRMAVVATPGYFKQRASPKTPHDLAAHNCINLRLPTHGEYLAWEFDRKGQSVNARVDGQWAFSSSPPMREAALAGFGLAYLPEDMVLWTMSPRGVLCGCWSTGASLLPATTSTTPIAAIPPAPSNWWSTRCDTSNSAGEVSLQRP